MFLLVLSILLTLILMNFIVITDGDSDHPQTPALQNDVNTIKILGEEPSELVISILTDYLEPFLRFSVRKQKISM